MVDPGKIRYLLVTHIPFAPTKSGGIILDGRWARDMEGLAGSGWKLKVCAPEIRSASTIRTWGSTAAISPARVAIEFAGCLPIARLDSWAGAVPVAAFRTPASVETVQDSVDGLLPSLDDIQSVASAIGPLHTDRELLIRLAGAAPQRTLWKAPSQYRLPSIGRRACSQEKQID